MPWLFYPQERASITQRIIGGGVAGTASLDNFQIRMNRQPSTIMTTLSWSLSFFHQLQQNKATGKLNFQTATEQYSTCAGLHA